MNHWERFHKIFIASVYVAIIAGGAMIIYPKYGEMTLRKNECDKVCELLAQKEQAIRALKDKQYRMMHDPVYVNGGETPQRRGLARGLGHGRGVGAVQVRDQRPLAREFFKQVPRRAGVAGEAGGVGHFGVRERGAVEVAHAPHGRVGVAGHGGEQNRRRSGRQPGKRRGVAHYFARRL